MQKTTCHCYHSRPNSSRHHHYNRHILHYLLLLLLPISLLGQVIPDKVPEHCLPPAPKTKVEPKEGPGAADILFVVDTSGSMGDEAANVAKNLNSFGQHLSDEGIDFHLIVVEKDMSSVRLCVEPPLADKTCTSKVAGKKFFIQYL